MQMSKFYDKICEAVRRLVADKDGVISFEYVVLAACIVGVVLIVFGTGNQSVMYNALNNAITTIANAVNVQITP
jgi:Flp pilus assembly pilin Flp